LDIKIKNIADCYNLIKTQKFGCKISIVDKNNLSLDKSIFAFNDLAHISNSFDSFSLDYESRFFVWDPKTIYG